MVHASLSALALTGEKREARKAKRENNARLAREHLRELRL
jgi:hypothetical protein